MSEFFASSPERYSFLHNLDKQKLDEGKMSQETFDKLDKMWSEFKIKDSIADTQMSLENDLRSSKTISDKCKASEAYSQNLYAALCNNEFKKNNKLWSCSWRHSGGIIAHLREEGDYIDWYCSGIGSSSPYVGESVITDEIRKDIESLGWTIVENNMENLS